MIFGLKILNFTNIFGAKFKIDFFAWKCEACNLQNCLKSKFLFRFENCNSDFANQEKFEFCPPCTFRGCKVDIPTRIHFLDVNKSIWACRQAYSEVGTLQKGFSLQNMVENTKKKMKSVFLKILLSLASFVVCWASEKCWLFHTTNNPQRCDEAQKIFLRWLSWRLCTWKDRAHLAWWDILQGDPTTLGQTQYF